MLLLHVHGDLSSACGCLHVHVCASAHSRARVRLEVLMYTRSGVRLNTCGPEHTHAKVLPAGGNDTFTVVNMCHLVLNMSDSPGVS